MEVLDVMQAAELLMIVLVGLLQVVAGALAVVAASRGLSPNPIIGLRVSYSMVSRKAWRQLNKLAGLTLAGIGLACIVVGLAWGVTVEIALLLVGDTVASITLIEYSRRYAEKLLIAEPATSSSATPIAKPRQSLRITIVAASVASAAATLTTIHFLASRGMLQASLTLLMLLLLSLYFSYLSTRRPEAYAYPWLDEKEYEIILTLSPIVLSLLVISVDLLILGKSMVGLIVLLVCLILTALELFVAVRPYLKRSDSEQA